VTSGTVETCMAAASDRLRAAGVDEPRRETRLLLAHALGVDPATVIGYPERPVPDCGGFFELVERRAHGMPMAHILGRREFWSLEFQVTPDTLDPRPDSETIIESAVSALASRREDALSVLDLGTGTGCLLLATLSEFPRANGVGVDLSQAAARIARNNARRLKFDGRAHFIVGDWAAALDGRYDVILGNPPYIPSHEIPELQPEVVKYEPKLALDGGEDGLDAYRIIMMDLSRLLNADGIAIFEVGAGQWQTVAGFVREAGLAVDAPASDLSGIDRCVICHCS